MTHILNRAQVWCRSAFLKNIISSPSKRNNYEYFTNRTNAIAEKKYKLKDNISDDYRLVYREHSTISRVMVVAYHMGYIGIATSILSMGYFIVKRPPLQEEGMEGVLQKYDNVIIPLSNVGRVLMLCASFAVSIVLIVASKTIPFRIYHNPMEKMYRAVFVSKIFGKKQIETFGEGTVIPVFRRKSLGNVLFNMNGRIVILDKECFPVQSVREQMIRKTE